VWGAALTVVGLLAGGAIAYGAGAFDGVLSAHAVSAACGGLVDPDLAGKLVGADRLDGQDEGGDSCLVGAHDRGDGTGSLTIGVLDDRSNDGIFNPAGRDVIPYDFSAAIAEPLGAGWTGFLTTSEGDTGKAEALVPCAKEPDGVLVVTARAIPGPSAGRTDSDPWRDLFGRVITQALRRAAASRGCDAPLPRHDLAHVPPFTSHTLMPQGRGTGTCAGIEARTYGTAADATAPIEDCLVAGPDGRPRYSVTAYYGPFAADAIRAKAPDEDYSRPATSGGGSAWTLAACPTGRALYVVGLTNGPDGTLTKGDPAVEEGALRTFAAQSARRHGCSSPATF
jgi:hypothetical protein